jgi:NMD protein affecting ribosome stability and mRNA decay
MKTAYIPHGFVPIRHERILEELVHDAYKIRGKLPEPTVCPTCGAVFHEGRWQWLKPVPANAHEHVCPACQRVHDHFPAGFVHMTGEFLASHHDEILRLAHNEEAREKAEHPMKRIMSIRNEDGGVLISTTDIHLARTIGEAVHRAYQGKLDFHYNPEQNLLRVNWTK